MFAYIYIIYLILKFNYIYIDHLFNLYNLYIINTLHRNIFFIDNML